MASMTPVTRGAASVLLASALALPLPAAAAAAAPTPDAAKAPTRAVAVTIDDLPAPPYDADTAAEQQAIARAIAGHLLLYGIPAVGFVNEVRLETGGAVDPDKVRALGIWLDAGVELGNHTYSHPDLHRVPLARFEEDLVRGETVTRPLVEARGGRLRWFRHPFLHTGTDLDTKHALEDFLAERGYRVAPVTIDNSEWIFARAYARTLRRGDADAARRIADEYVAYMERKTDYYERQSVALFDREIPQVLLIHANRLNADHLGRVAAMLARRGYAFVTLDAALADAAYDSADMFTGRGGITWLHRWALSDKRRDAIVADEPRTPEFVMREAGVDSE